jgi:hypothetical protein
MGMMTVWRPRVYYVEEVSVGALKSPQYECTICNFLEAGLPCAMSVKYRD